MTTTRVLIVDDDALVRENLVAYLQDEGMEVDAVPSGEGAVALLRTEVTFDVCVMDMRLPGMDGNDGIRAIHAIAPRIGFIIHTGSADYSPPADLLAMGLGLGRIFHKPLQDMAPLAGTIRDLAGTAATNPRPPGAGGASHGMFEAAGGTRSGDWSSAPEAGPGSMEAANRGPRRHAASMSDPGLPVKRPWG